MRSQLRLRQPAVALVHRFREGVSDPGADPHHRGLLDPEPHRDRIRRQEPDAPDVPGKPIGVLRHHLHGIRPVGPVDAHGSRCPDAVAVQEDHDLAHDLLLGPGVGDPLRPHRADPGHLAQPFGLALDDVEDLLTERSHELPGVDRADPPDHPRSEVFPDARDGGRRGGADESRLELLTVGAVVDPRARGRDPLAGGHHGDVSDDGHEAAMPARPRPQHAEAVVRVVEGDALDEPGQHLPLGGSRPGARPRFTPSPERKSPSLPGAPGAGAPRFTSRYRSPAVSRPAGAPALRPTAPPVRPPHGQPTRPVAWAGAAAWRSGRPGLRRARSPARGLGRATARSPGSSCAHRRREAPPP